jgi:fumarate reductase flavoprotein subunit
MRALDADVIVVGGGGSGLAAAITAAEGGKRVILLEKASKLGGSTRLSVGAYSAADTSVQRKKGINDSLEQFTTDMIGSNAELEEHENRDLRDVLVRESTPAFEWLRSLGVQFYGPMPEPPFVNPRMHNVVPHSGAYISALSAAARRAGVDIRVGAPVHGLITDGGGKVVGVRAGTTLSAGAVVVATGDYSASRELKKRWISEQTSKIPPVNPANTGDGFTMAIGLGAKVCNEWRLIEDLRFAPPPARDLIKQLPTGRWASAGMRGMIEHLPPSVFAWFARRALTTWIAPSRELYAHGAILVSSEGKRFSDEQGNTARALADQRENKAWVVLDGAIAELFSAWPHPVSTFPGIAYAYLPDYARLRPDAYRESKTIEGLAAAMGVPISTFAQTIRAFNEAAARGEDREFGRALLGAGLHEPPFVALGPLGAVVTITDGGLLVDEHCHVLRDDAPIDGLFAVGSTGQGGLILKNHGLHIGWAISSGRVAGRAASEQ